MLHITQFFLEHDERVRYLTPMEKRHTAKKVREGTISLRRWSMGWVVVIYRAITKTEMTDDEIIDHLLSPIGS